MKTLLTLCLLVLLGAGDASAGRVVTGVVRAVYDGDTVLLATREESRLKIRLYGIDAPETRKPDQPGQPFGDDSKRALMKKIIGRQVSAEIIDVDQYKRVVAVIRFAGRDINREMVSEGMAWAYRQYLHAPYASEYIGRESRARSQRTGLWRDSKPLPPWEYRHALKSSQKQRKRW
ncbi:MAG TPA: nuclease [Desulfuromonadales bacterium]|nr:nuclease [Desulfuromonadales bacterium]